MFASKFIVFPGQVKGSKTFFRLNLFEKKLNPHEIHQLSISEDKILLITGNITKSKESS